MSLVDTKYTDTDTDETTSAIGGEIIMEDDGYPTVHNPYSKLPLADPLALPEAALQKQL